MNRRTDNISREYPNNQLRRIQQVDPHTQMMQMMRSFGGFQNDDLFGQIMRPFSSDPFQSMFNFSDLHKNVHQRGQQGSFVTQTFVSSSKMGSDGRMHREDYFENNIGEHRGGNTISQKHQAYKNNQGVNRIAQERMLNDRGRKIVREKRGHEVEETNHYYNIDQEDAQKFDSDWRRADSNMNFLSNHQQYMKSLGNGNSQQRQIEYNPGVYERRESRNMPRHEIRYSRR